MPGPSGLTLVRRLREETGAGVMDAKRALDEAGGNFDKARQLLRERGMGDVLVTAGGIILPDSVNEKKAMAMMKGTVVAIGETAWFEAEHDARNYGAEFARPAPGARVLIGKYSGVEVTGLDGESYRLMNDEDVIGRLEGAA